MKMDNDTRGWIMAAVSGIASIICVDLIIRRFPGKKNFKIEDSNSFLTIGLSLSFGVMIFSSLYSILPSSKRYLQDGGMSAKMAMLTMVLCFLGGAGGISVLSRILHQYIPHSVVDCDHEHEEDEEGKEPDHHDHSHSHSHSHSRGMEEQRRGFPDIADEESGVYRSYPSYGSTNSTGGSLARRPSLHTQISSKVSELVTGAKDVCDENGRCQGFSNPCGQKCFKNVQVGRGFRFHSRLGRVQSNLGHDAEHQPLLEEIDESTIPNPTQPGPADMESSTELPPSMNGHSHSSLRKHSTHSISTATNTSASHSSHHAPPHHHHVPTNAFLSIGLQTSTAIALHKIPEGFITYATNHANPRLGLSVFLALFIHNITEGFAMALPLYLAINSRPKAMFWSALLGGVSQPLGAGVAALWFRIAGRGEAASEPGETVYGVLFAVTAGIMAMVGLQLFGESLELTHSRKLCFASAFVGMGVLGLSSALTA
ncbi:Zinc/iron permease [Polyplosphaeria fusca]|uniref:Zinc/iron permease n=1 Tax=Polyplosphaeria fusca TaxID=682080 RepID=A0A9P4QW39_9PLEO|nr:Zinc/iron permease [Polyplosphaeria fusca]